MEELKIVAIEISDKVIEGNEELEVLRKILVMQNNEQKLYTMLYEITAASIYYSVPILVSTKSLPRILELLNHEIQTVIIQPLGDWAKAKKSHLSKNRGRQTVLALNVMGGAFIFITAALTGNPLFYALGFTQGSIALAATIINGK